MRHKAYLYSRTASRVLSMKISLECFFGQVSKLRELKVLGFQYMRTFTKQLKKQNCISTLKLV